MDPAELIELDYVIATLSKHDCPRVRRFGVRLWAWRTGDYDTLDEALRLKIQPGHRRLGTIFKTDERNRLLRQAAREFYLNLPRAAQASKIEAAMKDYFASSWQREYHLDDCPSRHAGTVYALIFAVLKQSPKLIGRRQIDRILTGE